MRTSVDVLGQISLAAEVVRVGPFAALHAFEEPAGAAETGPSRRAAQHKMAVR